MEDNTQTMVQSVKTKPPRKLLWWVFGVVIGTVMVVGVSLTLAYLYYAPVTRFIDGVYVSFQLPNDIKNVTFVSFGQNGSNLYYKTSGFGLEKVSYPQLSNSVSLNTSQNLKTFSKSFFSSNSETLPFSIGSVKPVDPNEWGVYTQNSTEDQVLVARGYAPIFVDEASILFFAQSGIVRYNTQSKIVSLVSSYSSTTKISQVQYSENRSHVLWKNEEKNKLILAGITSEGVAIIKTFSNLTSPILRNDSIYDLRFTEEGSELWRTTFDGSSVKVTTFPVSLNIQYIISN